MALHGVKTMSGGSATRVFLAAMAAAAGLAAAGAVLSSPEAASEIAAPGSVVTLTAVMAQGVWTDEEVTAANSWRRDFRVARPVVRRGQSLRLRLKSADVLHSFSVPALGVDPVEVYPGRVVELAIEAKQAGDFEYYCTTVCGEPHFAMRGSLRVVDDGAAVTLPRGLPAANYWREPRPRPEAGSLALGAWHFRQKGCVTCHGPGGRGGIPNPNSMNAVVPELESLARRVFLFTRADVTAFRDVLLSGRPLDGPGPAPSVPLFASVKTQYLAFRQLVREGRQSARLDAAGPRPPLDMPAWRSRLSEREVDLILAYLVDRGGGDAPEANLKDMLSKGETR